MITIKSQREIEGMKKSGAIIAGMHKGLRNLIKPGISTWEIEKFSRHYIESHGGRAAQIGFEGFEYATTVSVNEEVAHAFPRKHLYLKEGDIVKVDTVVDLDGYYSDSAWTYAVGQVSDQVEKLMAVTKKALYIGIDQAQVGNRVGDIGAAIDQYVTQENGYGNVREYVGHGIQPTMVNLGGWKVNTSTEDGWTVTTEDGSWSAQYEHVIAITNEGPKILTSQDSEFDAKYL
jgi:methionyl aminopeptidase